MADELPEKVREAIEKGPQRLYPCPRCKESGSVMGPSFMQTDATVEQDCRTCYGTGKLLELPEAFARRIARLATEEATRELRKRLERAQGALRAHANSADVLKGFEAPVPTPEQWGRIQPLASRLRDQLQAHALAIHEAKESAHD